MRRSKGFTLIELLVVIAIIGILAVLVLLALSSARQSARDAARKSVANSIATANEIYWDRNNTYATDVGDTDCANPAADTLIAAGLMGCPSQQARSGGGDARWDTVYAPGGDPTAEWSVSTELERGGSFACDQDGCR